MGMLWVLFCLILMFSRCFSKVEAIEDIPAVFRYSEATVPGIWSSPSGNVQYSVTFKKAFKNVIACFPPIKMEARVSPYFYSPDSYIPKTYQPSNITGDILYLPFYITSNGFYGGILIVDAKKRTLSIGRSADGLEIVPVGPFLVFPTCVSWFTD